MSTPRIILALLVFFSGRTAYTQAQEKLQAKNWNPTLAAKYLDERAQAWYAFSTAERGLGNDKITCVSCHTLLPFALARPALRKLTGEAEATAFETKVLEHVTRRVENWLDLDSKKFRLFYDSSEQKKNESWGTEAILNVLVLAREEHDRGRKEISPTTRKAFANLWQAQVSEGKLAGSWEWLDFGLEPWESKEARFFGAALAALAVGTAPGYYAENADTDLEKNVNLLRGYLREKMATQNLSNQLWILWASTKLSGVLTQDERKQLIQKIFQQQLPEGGWSPSSLGIKSRNSEAGPDADAYPTALVLHVLQSAGITKQDEKIAKGLAWLQSQQTEKGAWPSRSVNKSRDPDSHVGHFMPSAATAYAVMALGH